jgi:hypothetical protein
MCLLAKVCESNTATVESASGASKPLLQAVVGDSLRVVRPDGFLAFEDVYFVGRRRCTASVRVTTASGHSITAPTDQLAPVTDALDMPATYLPLRSVQVRFFHATLHFSSKGATGCSSPSRKSKRQHLFATVW